MILIAKAAATLVIAASSTSLVLLGSGAVGKGGGTITVMTPPRVTPSGPIFVAEDLVPGKVREANFQLENRNKADSRLYVSGRLTGATGDLYDALTARLTDRESGQVVWSGGLRQLLTGAAVGKLDGVSEHRYSLGIGIPDWAGSYYNGKRAQFDIDFTLLADRRDFDSLAPLTSINLTKSTSRRKFLKAMRKARKKRRVQIVYEGTAQDKNAGVTRVEVSLVHRFTKARKGKRIKYCRSYVPLRKKFVQARRSGCDFFWITANGTTRWKYKFRKIKFGKGAYELRVRSIDRFGNVEQRFRRIGDKVNYIRFRAK